MLFRVSVQHSLPGAGLVTRNTGRLHSGVQFAAQPTLFQAAFPWIAKVRELVSVLQYTTPFHRRVGCDGARPVLFRADREGPPEPPAGLIYDGLGGIFTMLSTVPGTAGPR